VSAAGAGQRGSVIGDSYGLVVPGLWHTSRVELGARLGKKMYALRR